MNSAPAGRASSRPGGGLAWDRLIRYRPRLRVYRSESEKEEGLVHLHTNISSPPRGWDSGLDPGFVEARNSTACSPTPASMRSCREGEGEPREASRRLQGWQGRGCGCLCTNVGSAPRIYLSAERVVKANRTLTEKRNFLSPEKYFLNLLCSKSFFQLKRAERGCSPTPTPGVQAGRLLLGLDTAAGPLPSSSAGCILMSFVWAN